jgi:O-antigen/teichoic acid export membrane protein
MNSLQKAAGALAPKFRHVLQFIAKQGIAMGCNMLYGFLCVRMLPVPEYAKFAVLFGYMGSLTVLLDIGVVSTLAPLIGEQVSNLPLIANYVASVRRIALRLYLVAAPIAAIVFILLVQRQHWGVLVVAQMVGVLLFTAWFARVSSTYGVVLTVRRDRASYYRAQIIGSAGSLALLILYWAFHQLNIYVCILLNVLQILYIAISYYRRAHELLGVKGRASRLYEKAIVRLAMPNVPSTLFYAIQGQITLMLITLFGHSSSSVADVGALSRLAQILVFFSQMNPILVEPFFSRLPAARLKRTYILSVLAVVAACAVFSLTGFAFPGVYLWILGPHYSQLRVEVGLLILGSAIRYVNGFMWVIHSSRRFVYWWNNLSNIALTILVQAVFLWKFDLSTVRSVLIFNIASALVGTIISVTCGIYGFWRGPQKLDPQLAQTGLTDTGINETGLVAEPSQNPLPEPAERGATS